MLFVCVSAKRVVVLYGGSSERRCGCENHCVGKNNEANKTSSPCKNVSLSPQTRTNTHLSACAPILVKVTKIRVLASLLVLGFLTNYYLVMCYGLATHLFLKLFFFFRVCSCVRVCVCRLSHGFSCGLVQ